MRPPRYRFPNEVRETTRLIASRMVREGTVAGSPEELEAWIARNPDVKEPLERGGYGERFTSDDLFPLLKVFLVQAGAPAPEPDAAPRGPAARWIGGLGLLIVVGVILLLLMFCAGTPLAAQRPSPPASAPESAQPSRAAAAARAFDPGLLGATYVQPAASAWA